jgi:anti-sigma regulatory factor (Ser/Thr protein kinase)
MTRDRAPGLVQVGESTIPSGLEAPSLARTLVAEWLDGRGSARLDDDVRLLVSELVTNSVCHAGQPAGAPVSIRAAAVDGVVRVEVRDQGHGPVRRRAPDRRTGGFGLHLVERLAARWGVNHGHGTCVWFELALHEPGS